MQFRIEIYLHGHNVLRVLDDTILVTSIHLVDPF